MNMTNSSLSTQRGSLNAVILIHENFDIMIVDIMIDEIMIVDIMIVPQNDSRHNDGRHNVSSTVDIRQHDL